MKNKILKSGIKVAAIAGTTFAIGVGLPSTILYAKDANNTIFQQVERNDSVAPGYYNENPLSVSIQLDKLSFDEVKAIEQGIRDLDDKLEGISFNVKYDDAKADFVIERNHEMCKEYFPNKEVLGFTFINSFDISSLNCNNYIYLDNGANASNLNFIVKHEMLHCLGFEHTKNFSIMNSHIATDLTGDDIEILNKVYPSSEGYTESTQVERFIRDFDALMDTYKHYHLDAVFAGVLGALGICFIVDLAKSKGKKEEFDFEENRDFVFNINTKDFAPETVKLMASKIKKMSRFLKGNNIKVVFDDYENSNINIKKAKSMDRLCPKFAGHYLNTRKDFGGKTKNDICFDETLSTKNFLPQMEMALLKIMGLDKSEKSQKLINEMLLPAYNESIKTDTFEDLI